MENGKAVRESVFINKCLGFKWKFIGQGDGGEDKGFCELALCMVLHHSTPSEKRLESR
jgi:hypothetical protein